MLLKIFVKLPKSVNGNQCRVINEINDLTFTRGAFKNLIDKEQDQDFYGYTNPVSQVQSTPSGCIG